MSLHSTVCLQYTVRLVKFTDGSVDCIRRTVSDETIDFDTIRVVIKFLSSKFRESFLTTIAAMVQRNVTSTHHTVNDNVFLSFNPRT
jgi:hypothetical protein